MSSYHTVAVSQTGQTIAGAGQAGYKGDKIKKIIAVVDTAGAGAAASILDGATSISIVPASAPIGVHTIDFGDGLISNKGAWSATTGANVQLIVIGDFSMGG